MNLTEKRQKVIHALSNTTRLNVLEALREKEMTVTE
ncbi:MAG: transcriptional regulator, partial [Lactococcus sp.]